MKKPGNCLTVAIAGVIVAFCGSQTRADDRLELWPLLSLTGQYTDNLDFSSVNARSDELGTAVGGGSLAFTNPDRRVKLDYLTDAQAYVEHPDFDQAGRDQYVDFSDHERFLADTALELDDTFIKGRPIFGQSLIGGAGLSLQLSQALLQEKFITNSFYTTLTHEFGADFAATFGAHQNLYSFSSAVNDESYNQGGSITFSDRLGRSYHALFGYDFEDFRFSSSPRTDTHAPFAGLAYDLTPELELTAQGGPLIVQTASEVRVEGGYSAAINYHGERMQAVLNSARQESTTAGFGGAAINQSVSGSMVYALSRRSNAFVNTSYSELSAGRDSSDILSWSAGIDYRIVRAITVYAQYLGFRTTTVGSPAVLTDVAAVGLRLTPEPWRWVW
jgi:hypothetical protein